MGRQHKTAFIGWALGALLLVSVSACADQATSNGVGGGNPTSLAAIATATPTATAIPTPTATPTPTPVPTTNPAAAPTQRPAAAPVQPTKAPAPPPPAPPRATCGAPTNPWGYNFCAGNVISSPPSNFCSVFNCIPSFWTSTNGYVEECADATYSHSGGRSGSCSHHGGNLRALLAG
jgi:hypothetical protein